MSSAARQRERHPERHEQTVAIAWCHPGTVSGRFTTTLATLMLHDGYGPRRIRSIIGLESSPRIANARNDMVRNFLATPTEWLLMVDSDMVLHDSIVEEFLAVAHPEKAPIIGALCFAGGREPGDFYPTLYAVNPDGSLRRYVEWPENAMLRVSATGAGCLFMHRDALGKIGAHFGEPHPWFVEGSRLKTGDELGEDVAFCFRAETCGYPIWVHTGIEVGHEKRWVLDSAAYEAQDIAARYKEADDGAGA